jgi:hypothetical protein
MFKLLLAICLVALLFAGLVYGAVLLDAGDRADAEQFCTGTPLGQPWADVEQRIKASKADQRQSKPFPAGDGMQSVGVTFHRLFPMSRHVCEVKLQNGRVSATATFFLD